MQNLKEYKYRFKEIILEITFLLKILEKNKILLISWKKKYLSKMRKLPKEFIKLNPVLDRWLSGVKIIEDMWVWKNTWVERTTLSTSMKECNCQSNYQFRNSIGVWKTKQSIDMLIITKNQKNWNLLMSFFSWSISMITLEDYQNSQ